MSLLARKLFVLVFFLIIQSYSLTASAFEAASPYWMSLKPKLDKYLEKNVNKNTYQYKIIGPTIELSKFLGNTPEADIRFSGLNLNSPSNNKNVVATAYDESGKKIESINISVEVLRLKKVLMLHKSVAKGQEITPDNVYEASVPINGSDERMFFDGNLKQKVANSNLAAGATLKSTMLRHEKLVQIGDSITVTSGSGLVTLEFMCKALGGADVGETINLNCPDLQKKTIKAEVTAPGRAKLL